MKDKVLSVLIEKQQELISKVRLLEAEKWQMLHENATGKWDNEIISAMKEVVSVENELKELALAFQWVAAQH